jgi:hypothetical protein
MTKDEALKLALETLEYAGPSWIEARQPAITAIEAALEAKDEPVAIFKTDLDGGYVDLLVFQGQPLSDNTLLYTTPLQRTWVGLTNEDEIDWQEGGNLKDLVKAIEAALKAKNS